jgi:hypothetical protein
MPPRRGCRLAVANEAFLHNAQFIMIGPTPAAITIGGGKNFNLRAGDKVGHKVGLTIGLSLRSDGRRRRFTRRLYETKDKAKLGAFDGMIWLKTHYTVLTPKPEICGE